MIAVQLFAGGLSILSTFFVSSIDPGQLMYQLRLNEITNCEFGSDQKVVNPTNVSLDTWK